MIRDSLSALVSASLSRLIERGVLPSVAPGSLSPVDIADTKNLEHGDFACNVAMVLAKPMGKNPREVAEALASELRAESIFAEIEVAGPGFINLRLTPEFFGAYVDQCAERFAAFLQGAKALAPEAKALKINVEYVSVNPNGPITVGSGRGAAFGSALANVLSACGHTVHREYYINDGVNSEQMRLFAESVRAIVEGREVPDNGYRGDYVADVAEGLRGLGLSDLSDFRTHSEQRMISRQREDLATFGVEFDTWFSEQSLHDSGKVQSSVEALVVNQVADEAEYRTKLKLSKGGVIEEVIRETQVTDEDDASEAAGKTLWLRSTKLGDDMDRVLRRRDGRLTYIASDVAYHQDKLNRPPDADRLITILGPDHHGYIGRLHAVLAACALGAPHPLAPSPSGRGETSELSAIEAEIFQTSEERDACAAALRWSRERLEVVIFQIVRFMKEGKPAPMRKRDGNIYALIDLIDELGKTVNPQGGPEEQKLAGKDVARFFYLMRSHETHMDFDIDLATRQSDENPVFYAQYAHARICSILQKAVSEMGIRADDCSVGTGSRLKDPREISLIKKIADLPHEVARAAEDFGVHRLTTFAVELARTYHAFYDGCRVLDKADLELSRQRLALCNACALAMRSCLALLGISAPERMERAP